VHDGYEVYDLNVLQQLSDSVMPPSRRGAAMGTTPPRAWSCSTAACAIRIRRRRAPARARIRGCTSRKSPPLQQIRE